MDVAVLGINYKQGTLPLREQLSQLFLNLFTREKSAQGEYPVEHFFVLLNTCNRIELYFSSSNLSLTHAYILNSLKSMSPFFLFDFEQKLYSFFQEDCFEHLVKVTSGLDSAFLGESDVQRQVKEAYSLACEFVRLPPALHFLFQKALKSAKSIRTQFFLESRHPTLENNVFLLGKKNFKEKTPRILFVGASAINQKIAHFLQRKNYSLAFTSRSLEKSKKIAEKIEADFIPFEEKQQWFSFDWIIIATKAPYFLLTEKETPFFKEKKLFLDLSLPRNIEPSLKKRENVVLYDIDEIHQQQEVSENVLKEVYIEASSLIRKEAFKHCLRFNSRSQLFQGILEKEWCL